jgi:tRNA 5-methylaminomethyl-2-thiouridine biosynthesis bifunctional protein
VPYSPDYDDLYHSVAGAWAQAQHVFLNGNGLPARWQQRDRFVVLETGFGLGNNFLATWAAWRADPHRCQRLVFISIEKHPLTLDDLVRVHQQRATDADAPEAASLAQRLCEAWPPSTPGLHVLDFAEAPGHGVTLLLGLGDVHEVLPQLMARVDAFYLDGFAPAKNADMWDPHLLSRLNRLAAPGATAATWSVARPVKDALRLAGFEVHKQAGFTGKRDMLTACFQPHHTPAPLPGGLWPAPQVAHRHALVIGAGLAGCAAAWALTREGWHVTLLEQHADIAPEASGNAGGMFHSIVHHTDNLHTRLHRAAALRTHAKVSPWISQGELPGLCEGLLRLDQRFTDEAARKLLHDAAWPSHYLTWLTQAQACAHTGLAVPHGGWCFQQGGWLYPAGYARLLLNEAQHTGLLTVRLNARVQQLLAAGSDATPGGWQACDADGQVLACAPSVVVCAAGQLQSLLGQAPFGLHDAALPVRHIRGQVSILPPTTPGLTPPRRPVAGNGYAIGLQDGRVLCGATTQTGDMDANIRASDHQHNLQQAMGLGVVASQVDTSSLLPEGRVGWRLATPDRLPLIGALPHLGGMSQLNHPPEQVRRMPRWRTDQGGVYVFSGLGSRGISWAALGGEVLAHWVTGSPCPVEAQLRDAMDPARFVVRTHRHAQPPHT